MKSVVIAIGLFAIGFQGYNAFAASSDAAKVEMEGPKVDAAAIIGEDFKPISLEEAQKPSEQQPAFANEAAAASEANAETATATAALPAIKPITLKENEIPVLTKVEAKKAQVSSPFARIGISIFVMAALFVGLVKFTNFWKKKTGQTVNENNKIRVLTQHYLGPRKSLAIIRVAGETILIGVTDNNINHIKSLALLEDEEIPTESPTNFAQSLKTAGADEQNENDSVWSTVRDRVSTKIKEMRPL